MSKNIIAMYRGDTCEFDLNMLDEDGNTYILAGGDTIYFGLMEPNALFEDSIVKKTVHRDAQTGKYTANPLNSAVIDEYGNITIIMQPQDTINLLPGVYYYMVKAHINHTETYPDIGMEDEYDAVVTVIKKTKFIIL